MNKPQFNVSSIRSIRSAAITEFRQLSPTVARVIATFVGTMAAAEAQERLVAVLKNRARPIAASFRWLEEGRAAIGYVTTTTPVREFNDRVVANYQQITANMFMDPADESLWEVKSGVGGSYLTRKGDDNLAELLEASRISPRGSTPRMSSVLEASVRPHQFVAFVQGDSTLVDYGFCLSQGEKGGYTVLSSTSKNPVEVAADMLVGVYTVEMPATIRSAVEARASADKTAVKAASDSAKMIDYYRRAYSYAPQYIEQIIRQIEQMAAL